MSTEAGATYNSYTSCRWQFLLPVPFPFAHDMCTANVPPAVQGKMPLNATRIFPGANRILKKQATNMHACTYRHMCQSPVNAKIQHPCMQTWGRHACNKPTLCMQKTNHACELFVSSIVSRREISVSQPAYSFLVLFFFLGLLHEVRPRP